MASAIRSKANLLRPQGRSPANASVGDRTAAKQPSTSSRSTAKRLSSKPASSRLASKSAAPFAPLTRDQAQWLATSCHQALTDTLAGRKSAPLSPPSNAAALRSAYGIFSSWHNVADHELRGCMGYTVCDQPLYLSAPETAVFAALGDKRFEPVEGDDAAGLILELSILGPLSPLPRSPAARQDAIRIGRDGLVLEYGSASGILLPQVAVEWNWKANEFLDALCEKAGLPPGMWKSASAKLFYFQAQIWREELPAGPISVVKLVTP